MPVEEYKPVHAITLETPEETLAFLRAQHEAEIRERRDGWTENVLDALLRSPQALRRLKAALAEVE